MPLISRLGVLIAYDPATEANKIKMEKANLMANSELVQDEIARIIQQKNADFHAQVDRRMLSIDATFQRMVPAIPPERKREIQLMAQEAVQRGVAGAPIDDVDLSEFC